MDWEAAGAISEIIGTIAVVVSLVYVAIQIREQNLQAKLSALHDMSIEQRDASAMFATREISEILVRANEDYSAISNSESVQLMVVVTGLFRAWENAFLEYKDGNLDRSVWEALSKDYTQPMGSSSFQHIWRLRKQNYDPEFQSYINGIRPTEYILK